MELDAREHPDPIRDAISHGTQRAVQIASAAVTAAQVVVYLKQSQTRIRAERSDRARRASAAHARAEQEAARSGWAPALDPAWLRRADLAQTARAWAAAAPYADRSAPWHEPSAADAMRRCEERLRDLHPRAMAGYDRLRAEGMDAAGAMREAAPLFAQAPRAQDPPYRPRPALIAGTGKEPAWAATPDQAGGPDATAALERQGLRIVGGLQSRASAQGRPPLGETELRIVLETVTNLPAEVIGRIVSPAANLRRPADRAVPADPARAGRPWRHDFPAPIRDVVASARAAAGIPAPSGATASGMTAAPGRAVTPGTAQAPGTPPGSRPRGPVR